MIQYYSTKQYFHFDCIVLLYVLYNTLMLVVKNEHIICPYDIHDTCITILYRPLSTSQSERITMIPSPLTSNNLSTHSCRLWTHDVSCLKSYCLARIPNSFNCDVCIDLNKSSHAAIWIYQQSKVINNIDICCDLWCWMMVHHTYHWMDTESK